MEKEASDNEALGAMPAETQNTTFLSGRWAKRIFRPVTQRLKIKDESWRLEFLFLAGPV